MVNISLFSTPLLPSSFDAHIEFEVSFDAEVAGLEQVNAALETSNLYPAITDFEAALAKLAAQPTDNALRATALAQGMVLMRDDGQRLVDAGITSAEELLRVTRD